MRANYVLMILRANMLHIPQDHTVESSFHNQIKSNQIHIAQDHKVLPQSIGASAEAGKAPGCVEVRLVTGE